MTETLEIHDLAHGGDGVGRLGGKVVFVPGVIPGEIAEVEIVDNRRDFAHAELVRVIEPSPQRIDAPCPHFDACGGCQWQFIDRSHQAQAKHSTLIGQLRHLGRLADPPVDDIVLPGPDFGYRNRMDFTVHNGRPALTMRRTNRPVSLEVCLLLTPALGALFGKLGDLGRLRSISLRAGEATGELLVVLSGPVPRQADTWQVPVVRPDGTPVVGTRRSVTERILDTEFRITAGSFFQNNSHGAQALVELVTSMLNVDRGDRLLDGYAGVGLFACTVGRTAGSVICVESSVRSVPDLERNLEEAAVPAPDIVVAPFEEISDETWTVAVVDPPRAGLRRVGVDVVTAPKPRAVAYVSCDPAGLARDTRYFAEAGYRVARVVPVDMFPQTYHLESVALFLPDTL